ncbi:MAG: SusC/RagA family TonB-linked outer membrane protein [Tannerella sp.]|jgi:TonB-linked SusC/RagA family outer membrane protein|nr:SusC/RagA family TonB-linked outer membrane protein [Tannerella sp.]
MNKLVIIFQRHVLRKTLLTIAVTCLCALTIYAQQGIRITGTVVDDAGEPLVGASVSVKGTTTGIITDIDGKFTVNVPNRNSVLVFSYVGFTTQEVAVGSQTVVNVTMTSGEELEEVVVTALGIKRQTKALSYATSEVKGDDLAKTPELNVMNALLGTIAGVDINNLGTGAIGSSSVTIRGNTSISRDNNPMYVIDGVPIMRNSRSNSSRDLGDALTTLNPNDIESLNVLKGAAATALYGSRASNGVILITTKSGGSATKGIGVSYNGSFGFEQYANPYTKSRQTLYGNSGANGDNTSSYLYQWNAETHRDWGPRFDGRNLTDLDGNQLYWNNEQDKPLIYEFQEDHWNEFMRTGYTMNNSVSYTGGTGNQRYRISASDLRYTSPVPNSNMNRQTIGLSTNSTIAKIVQFNGRINYSTAKTNNRPNTARYVSLLNIIPTNVPIIWMRGDPNKFGARPNGDGRMLTYSTNDYYQNPWWSAYQDLQEDTRDRLSINGDLRITITPWLFATGRMGLETQTLRNEDIEADGFIRGNNNGRGRIQQFTELSREFNVDWSLVFQKSFNKLDVSAFVGGSLTRNYFNRDGLQGDGMVIEYWNVITNANIITANVARTTSGINSLYGNAEISYNNLVYLTATGRNDWFSALNPAVKNNIFYPSVGLSYLMSQHLKLPSWWSFAKIRASYAEVGGGAEAFATKLAYNINSIGYLGKPYLSIPDRLENPGLMPYNTREYEVGIDFRFLNNRINIDYAYYDKQTNNDIVSVTTPQATGYTSARVNLGAIGNKGHELTLSVIPVQTKALQWNMTFAYAFNKGEVLDLGGVSEVNESTQGVGGNIDIKHIVGKQPYAIYGYTQRVENGQPVWERYQMSTADGQPYNVWYPTRNADKEFLGYGVNPNAASFSTSVRWKDLTLSATIDAKWGGIMIYSAEDQMIQRGTSKQTLPGRDGGLFIEGVYNSGTGDNPVWTNVKDAPSYVLKADARNFLKNDITIQGNEMPYEQKFFEQYYRYGQATRIADMLVFDASYVKFRQITLNYSIPQSALAGLHIQSANISFVARNLFDIYNKLPGGDPSINSGNGVNNNLLPSLRTYTLNLNVNF